MRPGSCSTTQPIEIRSLQTACTVARVRPVASIRPVPVITRARVSTPSTFPAFTRRSIGGVAVGGVAGGFAMKKKPLDLIVNPRAEYCRI